VTSRKQAPKKSSSSTQLIAFLNRYALYLTAFGVVFTYFFYLSPALDRAKQNAFALQDLEARLQERQAELANQATYQAQLERLKREVLYLESVLKPLEAEDLIARVEEKARTWRLKVESLSPTEPRGEEGWRSVQVSLSGKGRFADLYGFIKELESENAYPASVSSLTVSPSEEGVTFSLTVTFVGR